METRTQLLTPNATVAMGLNELAASLAYAIPEWLLELQHIPVNAGSANPNVFLRYAMINAISLVTSGFGVWSLMASCYVVLESPSLLIRLKVETRATFGSWSSFLSLSASLLRHPSQ